MRYFIDCEFTEGKQSKTFLGIKYSETSPTVDLISIGIVSEDNREYYAVSKDFNLIEAWNRFELETYDKQNNLLSVPRKIYWLRDNVLKPIFYDFMGKDIKFHDIDNLFTYREFKKQLNKYGKPNKQIAEEIVKFVHRDIIKKYDDKISFYDQILESAYKDNGEKTVHEFYGYYADYDWVVFCWLFGGMMNLPKGFPMFCIDLKQMLDEKASQKNWEYHRDIILSMNYEYDRPASFDEKLSKLKTHHDYPKQTNEHDALADSRFNRDLYRFLKEL